MITASRVVNHRNSSLDHTIWFAFAQEIDWVGCTWFAYEHSSWGSYWHWKCRAARWHRCVRTWRSFFLILRLTLATTARFAMDTLSPNVGIREILLTEEEDKNNYSNLVSQHPSSRFPFISSFHLILSSHPFISSSMSRHWLFVRLVSCTFWPWQVEARVRSAKNWQPRYQITTSLPRICNAGGSIGVSRLQTASFRLHNSHWWKPVLQLILQLRNREPKRVWTQVHIWISRTINRRSTDDDYWVPFSMFK